MRSKILLPLLMATFWLILYINAELRFTNIKCEALDKDFCEIEYCFLKSHNRSFKYLSLKVNLLKKPVSKISVRWALLKRANGYKPFLYNFTFNECNFLSGKKSNPVLKYFHDWFIANSNINHTCPFNHDLIVEKLDTSRLNDRMTKLLPLPCGEYCLDMNWFAYGMNRAIIRVYYELK